jgi:hypothetical protein
MRRSVLLEPFSLPERWVFAPVAASLALAGCIGLPNATASRNVTTATMTRSGVPFDHCLLGSWRLRAAKGSDGRNGDLVGMTVHVALGHGLTDGSPFGVMTANLAGSASLYGQSTRGTQSVAITTSRAGGGRGEYGVVRMISNKVVVMEGTTPVYPPGYVLGTLAIYTCSSSQIHITFFDNADLGSATFARL